MSNTNIRDAVLELFEEVFGIPANSIAPGAARESFEEWDSLGHIRLVAALESRFGVSFTVEQIESIQSVDDVVTLVESLAAK